MTEDTKLVEREDISADLRENFSFQLENFSVPIVWTDAVGISRIKRFGDGRVSLYKLGILNKELDTNNDKKQLWVSVSYGKETEGGVTIGSESGISKPVDLDFRDDFYYNSSTKEFFYKEKDVTPQELLLLVQAKHELPMRIGRGLYLRTRLLFWRKLLPGAIKVVDLFLVSVLWVISGVKVKGDIMARFFGTIHTERSDKEGSPFVEFDEAKTMDFFGYHAKRWSVVFYCVLHLSLYVIYEWTEFRHPWLSAIFNNSFLLLCYVVVSFATTEAAMPALLKWLIGKTNPRTFGKVVFMTLKV